MNFDHDILGTIATQQQAGAEPRDVLDTLRGHLDPTDFFPDWDGVALALSVLRRRIAMRGVENVVPMRGKRT